MLDEVSRRKALQLLAKCLRECDMVKRRHVHDGDIRRKFLRSEYFSGESCRTLRGHDRSQSRIRISGTETCVWHEHRIYATPECGAETEMMSIRVLIRMKVTKRNRYEREMYYYGFVVFWGGGQKKIMK